MKTLPIIIIAVALTTGISTAFSQSANAEINPDTIYMVDFTGHGISGKSIPYELNLQLFTKPIANGIMPVLLLDGVITISGNSYVQARIGRDQSYHVME